MLIKWFWYMKSTICSRMLSQSSTIDLRTKQIRSGLLSDWLRVKGRPEDGVTWTYQSDQCLISPSLLQHTSYTCLHCWHCGGRRPPHGIVCLVQLLLTKTHDSELRWTLMMSHVVKRNHDIGYNNHPSQVTGLEQGRVARLCVPEVLSKAECSVEWCLCCHAWQEDPKAERW